MSMSEAAIATCYGLLPFILLFPLQPWLAAGAPIAVFILLVGLMKRRLQGYTGDCCGATFLLCELSFYIGTVITFSLWR